jgi:hypothetical protein
MFIQSLSSFDMRASLWHPACFTRYKQLYQGIERRYNPDGKGYYLKKREDF